MKIKIQMSYQDHASKKKTKKEKKAMSQKNRERKQAEFGGRDWCSF
jgi:hypothetical protein